MVHIDFDIPEVEYIGYAAMLCATMIYMPQIVKIYRTKSVESLSYGLILIELVTDVLWNIYAQMRDIRPLMFSSGFLFLSCSCVLVMKIRYEQDSWYLICRNCCLKCKRCCRGQDQRHLLS